MVGGVCLAPAHDPSDQLLQRLGSDSAHQQSEL
jgi:hypothetical protein